VNRRELFRKMTRAAGYPEAARLPDRWLVVRFIVFPWDSLMYLISRRWIPGAIFYPETDTVTFRGKDCHMSWSMELLTGARIASGIYRVEHNGHSWSITKLPKEKE
jgi:hypothetical protein